MSLKREEKKYRKKKSKIIGGKRFYLIGRVATKSRGKLRAEDSKYKNTRIVPISKTKEKPNKKWKYVVYGRDKK